MIFIDYRLNSKISFKLQFEYYKLYYKILFNIRLNYIRMIFLILWHKQTPFYLLWFITNKINMVKYEYKIIKWYYN